jgi:hypothetical protein
VGALQRFFALFETGTVIPEVIVKGRIALERLPTVGTFFPLARLVELHHSAASRFMPYGMHNTSNDGLQALLDAA